MAVGPEAKFQAKIITWLKKHGCVVIKYEQNATTKAGIPDIIWFYKSKYGFLEVKRSKDAPFQPLQEEMIKTLGKWTYARVVFPENFDIIKKEIEEIIVNENLQS